MDDNSMLFFSKKKKSVEFVPVVLPDLIDPDMPRKKVLVVDDDRVTLKALSLALTARGYDVLTAADASEAISVVRDQNPDIMLVDVGLPPDIAMGGANLADGFQLTRWLQRSHFRKIPAIIISASDKPAYQRQAAAVGADAFIAKPLSIELLVEAIESVRVHRAPESEGFETLKMAEGTFAG